MTRASMILLLLAVGAGACADRDGNFSQHPGFAEYYARHPRATAPATPAERDQLARHRPRYFLPPGHPGLIGFYDDYIAQGTLADGRGRIVSDRVTPEILNAYKEDPGAVFVHRPRGRPAHPVVYGRVDRETVTFPTGRGPVEEPFTFLTYHAVFRRSGLPAGLPWWQRLPLRLAGLLDDWHQLDHYTAVTIALDRDLAPVAVTMQQHNYMRTYLVGGGIDLPADGRVQVDVAIGSNELYPHAPARVRHRAASFLTPAALRYFITGQGRPFMAADDVTEGTAEADYRLDFLAPADAFYAFQGYLGERRRLPGRDGPPGADYNTLPELKPRAVQLLAFYWREGSLDDLARADAVFRSGRPLAALAEAQAGPFYRDWQCARRHAPAGCSRT